MGVGVGDGDERVMERTLIYAGEGALITRQVRVRGREREGEREEAEEEVGGVCRAQGPFLSLSETLSLSLSFSLSLPLSQSQA